MDSTWLANFLSRYRSVISYLFKEDIKNLKTISEIFGQQTILGKCDNLVFESAAARVVKVLTRSETSNTNTTSIITTEKMNTQAELCNLNGTTQRLQISPEMKTNDVENNVKMAKEIN